MKVYFERVGSEVNFVLCSESSVERSVLCLEREREVKCTLFRELCREQCFMFREREREVK